MKCLLLNVFLSIFLFASVSHCANLYVAIDMPSSLGREFANVRKYLVHGQRSKQIFGISYHITNIIRLENDRRRKKDGTKAVFLENDYSINQQIDPHLRLVGIGGTSSKDHIKTIKEALTEAVNKYAKSIRRTTFRFKMLSRVHFFGNKKNEVDLVEKVYLGTSGHNISLLIKMIKDALQKNKITFAKGGFNSHIVLEQIESKDPMIIALIKKDQAILDHLKSVEPPKGTKDGFDVKAEINLYDGPRKLETYSL